MAAFTSKISSTSQITPLFTLLLIIFSPSSSSAAKSFKKIYAFGDSFTDTGNTHSTSGPSSFTYVSNPPYGRTFFHRPTNRYSDGRLVIDFVAQALSLPFLPPYLNRKADTSYGVNFAVAGSTAIDHRFFVENNISLDITPQSLDTQLNWFNRYLEGVGCRDYKSTPMQCGAVFDDALFWALLKKGAKYVVVEGLPTTGCLTLALYLAPPADRDAMGCVATVNDQSHTHNAILQSNLAAFRRSFPEATILYADYWNAYKSILTAAKSHGITQPFRACCGSGAGDLNFDIFATCGSPNASSCPDPSQYINWDGVHLTEAMYKAVADKFVNGTFCHPPFSYLIRKKMASALLA
nr:GDSL esterase/lipase At3g48460 [Ipomoea batatas]